MGSLKGVPHRKWTKEEKLRIVKMHLEDHISIMEIEKKEHVRNGLVSTWCKRYVEEGEAALESHKGNKFSALHCTIVKKMDTNLCKLLDIRSRRLLRPIRSFSFIGRQIV